MFNCIFLRLGEEPCRGDREREIRLLNQQSSECKFTTLQTATYHVRTLSGESHLVELEKEIENIQWDIIGISEMGRPCEKIIELGTR